MTQSDWDSPIPFVERRSYVFIDRPGWDGTSEGVRVFDPDADTPLNRLIAELGEPDAMYSVSPGRARWKMVLGFGLVACSLIGNYLWWMEGPGRPNHLVIVLLFAPLVTGVSLLWHLTKVRGTHVLIYPTGVFRMQGYAAESFPWDEIDSLTLQTDNGEVHLKYGDDGKPTACWIRVEPPTMKIWDVGITIERRDGTTTTLTPALADYPDLVEELQRGTFSQIWPEAWEKFGEGTTLEFGPFAVSWLGLHHGSNLLPWSFASEVTLSQKKLTVKRSGKWLPWAVADLSAVPNPHVFLAIITEAKRVLSPTPREETDEPEE